MKSTEIKGLIPAIVTPMDKNGNVNLKAIDAYARHLTEQGVDGIFACGTTGEGLLMTTDERKAVAEAWMQYAQNFKILIHVGSTCYKTSAELARHAESIGADAISAMGPCFLQPSRVKELVDINKEIARHAPNTPYYYYHIPTTSGVNINMLQFLTEATAEIPTLCGIKYTSYNTMEMMECVSFRNKAFNILHGHDETFLMGLICGAQGGIGTSYNVTAKLFKDLLAAFYSGNIEKATDIQSEAIKFIRIMIKYVNAVVGVKAILNIMGIDCGPCRLPLQNLTKEEIKLLEADLKSINWL